MMSHNESRTMKKNLSFFFCLFLFLKKSIQNIISTKLISFNGPMKTLYCFRTFGAKCAKCGRSVGAGDWVRRARERVYHLACFACDACSRQLSTGEQFALLDARLLCKAHYLDVVEGNNTSSSEDCDSEHGGKGSKTKRVRTTFTEEQLSVLQANFQLDSNPDGQDLERIAHVTGLSKRVTQVWFQNSRARQKKHSGKIKTQSEFVIRFILFH